MLKVYRSLGDISFHTMSREASLEELNSDYEGISGEEAYKRKDIYGKNVLQEGARKTISQMFIQQFKNIMIIVLMAAALISGLMQEFTDTIIILSVILINAVLGVVQENKAEKALAALKNMSSPYAKVKRDGKVKQVKSEDVVPGDIVLLEAGDFVPADMRLLECASLKIEEAALTGESLPSEKSPLQIDMEDIVIGDRLNMAYSGSSVVYGRGLGVVTAIGMDTEVGKIASHLTKNQDQETPLQKKISEISKYLSIGVVAIAVVIFLAGVLQQRDYFEMFLIAVSLAVAAIPEGLPAVITIVLAMGVQKMARRSAIVRKLSAVETLGSTEVICSDKTGTLTQNKMTVKEVYIDGAAMRAEDLDDTCSSYTVFMQAMVLCNDSRVARTGNSSISATGDPTETALVNYASGKGFFKDQFDKLLPRVDEVPFDSERKLMTTVHDINDKLRVLTKGAPDVLLDRCRYILQDGRVEPLSAGLREKLTAANALMAGKALRVLALAYKDMDAGKAGLSHDNLEEGLVFAGLVGMMDPPRPEAFEAVRICSEAGIRPIMITGDHRATAAAIAKELGIIEDEGEVITGKELNAMSDEEFYDGVAKYSVYARVSPEHKVKIVNAWKKRGKVVAMTGDGVNDAPALKASDIGVGMGITGTDVAKGVSNMVLADDNFATIIVAVEEGRRIYSNIQKAIQFLLSSNLGEIITLFIATMLNWTILLPIHILWVNLVTDTLPALALGFEKAEKDVMKRKPRNSRSSFFSEGMGVSIVYQGVLKGLITLLVYHIGTGLYGHDTAVTMAFATLGLIQLAHSMNVRSNKKSLFKLGFFTNMHLIGAIAVSALLQLVVIIVPYLAGIFKVTPLNAVQWVITVSASLSIIPLVEMVKEALALKQKRTQS